MSEFIESITGRKFQVLASGPHVELTEGRLYREDFRAFFEPAEVRKLAAQLTKAAEAAERYEGDE